MKLKISNFAMIKEAEIEIDGITVIAGHNNTGKSTIGKVLFSLFNSLHDIEKKVYQKRKDEILEVLYPNIRNYIEHKTIVEKNIEVSNYRILSNRITSEIMNSIVDSTEDSIDNEWLSKIISMVFKKYDFIIDESSLIEILELVSDKILSTVKLSDNLITREIISRCFDIIFSGQINCLIEESSEAKLELIIKNKTINTFFINNQCVKYEPTYNIMHEAFYIDNPFIVDEIPNISNRFINSRERGFLDIKNHIISKLTTNNDIMDGIIDAVIAKEKLEEIYMVLNKVVKGNIVVSGRTMGLETKGFSEPIKLTNLSTGLKSFVIIKMLLERGILKEKDVLILDEPEIHLHPEWQLNYAEIIVLLQKIFDLSIIVTTHSSNFLEAIDYFSKKYSIDTRCKYYLASSEDGINSFEDVTKKLDTIYAQMIEPSVLLDKLKYEMEDDEYE